MARGDESASIRPYEFNRLRVEPREGTISGPVGRVRVDPQVMAVLLLLLQSAGKVVTREELLERVWPGKVVGDDALSRCIYQLREHMSQAGGSNTYRSLIETLPKRGYRLNAENTRSPVAMRWSSWKPIALMAAAAGAVAVGAMFWIAERPGKLAPPAADGAAYQAYVSATDYYQRADHRTALPYAVAFYEQATELDPAFLLAWAGLARAHTDMYWYGIDRTPARLERAEAAIGALLALNSDSVEVKLAKANYLLKGLNQFQDALQELEQAERSMPRDPELFFLRAMALRRLGAWESAVEALNAALDLDPDNITYLRQLFVSHQFVRDYDRAEQFLDRILELYPDDGTAYVDRVVLSLCRDGDTSPFRSYDESAPSQYYDDGVAYTYTGWLAAIYDRDYETAFRILDGAGEGEILDGDFRNASFGPKVLYYARTHRLAGHSEDAREAFTEVIRLFGESPLDSSGVDDRTLAGRYLALAEAQAGLGQPEAALKTIRHATALLPPHADALMGSSLLLNSVIRVLAPAGYDDEALRALSTYLSSAGHWSIEGLRKDPRLETLGRSVGFKALEQQFGR